MLQNLTARLYQSKGTTETEFHVSANKYELMWKVIGPSETSNKTVIKIWHPSWNIRCRLCFCHQENSLDKKIVFPALQTKFSTVQQTFQKYTCRSPCSWSVSVLLRLLSESKTTVSTSQPIEHCNNYYLTYVYYCIFWHTKLAAKSGNDLCYFFPSGFLPKDKKNNKRSWEIKGLTFSQLGESKTSHVNNWLCLFQFFWGSNENWYIFYTFCVLAGETEGVDSNQETISRQRQMLWKTMLQRARSTSSSESSGCTKSKALFINTCLLPRNQNLVVRSFAQSSIFLWQQHEKLHDQQRQCSNQLHILKVSVCPSIHTECSLPNP